MRLLVFSNEWPKSISDWQSKIDQIGLNLKLPTIFPLEALNGRVPTEFNGDEAGFNFYRKQHDELDAWPRAKRFSQQYKFIAGFDWEDASFGPYSGPIAAITFADLARGDVFHIRDTFQDVEDDRQLSAGDIARYLAQLQKINDIHARRKAKVTKYKYDERPNTKVSALSAPALLLLRNQNYAVLVGRNNCGKSYLLKTLAEHWGKDASYIGPARYHNFNLLGFYTPNRDRKTNRFNSFLSQWTNSNQNVDDSPINLQQAIAELSNDQRQNLTSIIKKVLNIDLEIRQTVENNSMSQKYVSVGDHNISYTSSGLRLITTLVTSLLDTEFDTFLIDEPELGISPEAQGLLADFLFSRDARREHFPHIRHLIFATHSTIFLDRTDIRNNFTVQKSGDEITIQQISNLSEFNKVHFFLLGNRFETLFLPSIIVMVEGKTDFQFIQRVLSLKFPDSQISVIHANGDGEIKRYIHIAKNLLTDIQKSPYHNRLFVVLDSAHSAGIEDELQRLGVAKQNIVEWPNNGIEYHYPPKLMESIFPGNDPISIEKDTVSRGGISYTKQQLVDLICNKLDSETEMDREFSGLFLNRLKDFAVTK